MTALSEKFTKEELEELSTLCDLCGELRKKGDNLFNSTKKRFFRFYCYGRYLAYFDAVPNKDEKPKNVIYMEEVKSVTVSDKKPHSFTMCLINGKDLVLKAKDGAEAEKWVNTIRRIKKIFEGKVFNDADPHRDWKDKTLDLTVFNALMEEVEIDTFAAVKDHLEYKEVLEAKGVFDLYNGFKDHTKKTRFMMGYADYSEIDYEGKESDTLNDPGMNFKGGKFLKWERVFLFMFTAKSFVEEHAGDLRLVRRARLQSWLEFDVLFIFTYEGPNDKSEFIDKIPIKDAFLIEPLPPGLGSGEMKYPFRIETPFKTYTFSVQLGLEVTNWMRILKRAKRTTEEIIRTNDTKLRKNIDKLVALYRNKNISDVVAYCEEEFRLFTLPIRYERTKPHIIIKTMGNAQLNNFDILDAIQAHRPFYEDLLKAVMVKNHQLWTEVLVKYYNLRFKEFGGGTILQFAELASKQKKYINKYGMKDARYDKAVHDILVSFFNRIFQTMMPLVLEVLDKMKTEYDKEKETICESHGPVDLFRFMNEVYDQSMACLDPAVQKGALGLIFKMVYIFQKEFKILVLEAEDMPMEVFCALTNSNLKFIACSRALVDKVKGFGILKEDEIMMSLSYSTLMKNFAQISQAAFGRIEQVMWAQLDLGFAGPYKKFDMEKFLTTTLQVLNAIMLMLKPNYSKKMWKSVFEHFVKAYILKLLEGCNEYKPIKDEVKQFLAKILKERQFAKDVFESNIAPKDLTEGVSAIKLYERAMTEPREDLVQILFGIAQRLKEKYHDNYLKWFQKYRTEFGSKEKQELMKLIENDKVLGRKKKDPGLEFYKRTMKEMYKHKFIRKLREKMLLTRKRKKETREMQEANDEAIKKLEKQLAIEEMAEGLKGWVYMHREVLKGEDIDPDYILDEALKIGPTTSRVNLSIADNMLIIKTKPSAVDCLYRIKFWTITNMGVFAANKSIYITLGKDLYIFKTSTDEELAKWVKVLTHMNEMNANWTESPDFTQFSFQEGIHDFETLFEKDVPNYGYEAIKIKKEKDKVNQKFVQLSKKFAGGKDENAEGKLNRSVEQLSDSSDESPPAKKGAPVSGGKILPDDINKSPGQKNEVSKEPEKKEDSGFWGGAKKLFSWG